MSDVESALSPTVQAALRARVAVRGARRRLRELRPVPGWDAPLGPVRLGGATVALRLPEVADGPAWRALRLAERERLEPWWPVDGDWAAAQGVLAWTEQCTALRTAARHGRAHPFVLVVDGRLAGQVGVDAVDLGTGTGEFSAWVGRGAAGSGAALLAGVLIARRAFTGPVPLARLVAPVSVRNPGPVPALQALGFTREATFAAYRDTADGRGDHDVWVLHGGPAVLDGLAVLQARLCAGREAVSSPA